MSQVQVEQKIYEMPPREGFTVAHFLTVADIERSARFYATVFGGRILSKGDKSGAPAYIEIANTWLIVNIGGGPTPDKPSVTLGTLTDPDRISSFMNIRVADIQACYDLWRSRGAEFITEPKPKYGETRCYIRDPDGYIIEVGQSNPGVTYGSRLNPNVRSSGGIRCIPVAFAEHTLSKQEPSVSQVQVEQKIYEMPPREGFTVAHFLTVADMERSAQFYATVFGGRILSKGDSRGAPAVVEIANTWLIVNIGGGPTPDKPSVTLGTLTDPDRISSFMNIRVADIQACYDLWRSRGAEFITEPKPKYGETRCYIRDPDGYVIEVGQSNPGVTYG